ncbi:MAG TPA: protein kinase [Blastocatellia bacterium]|nr:protein kinase [Blastocatellia bacterium]
MTPELYERVCRICYSALQLEAGQRSGFLARACAGDAFLRSEVEAMLTHEGRAESFLATPALLSMPPLTDAANHDEDDLDAKGAALPGCDHPPNNVTASPSEGLAGYFAPGAMLGGRYVIERELGQGGTCAVFFARDRKLHDAPVVIKVLLNVWRQTMRRTWLEKKFRIEIAALSRIDHPGVVRALDVGALPDGRSYLVMQYVSGESLRSAMTRGGMEFERIAKIIRQMGQALAAAHRQGVIHRDLKPENIMLQILNDEEYVKLIDFGIATIHELPEGADCQTTEVVGTRSYVAPEQLRGKPVAASDIYALGVIAYELVTGRRPFNDESIFQLYESQRAGVKVKPRELRADLPEASQDMILKALSFVPEDRFTNAKDFTDAFADSLGGEGSPLATASYAIAGLRRWLAPLALTLLAVIGILDLPRFSIGNKAQPEEARTTPVVASDRRLNYIMEARRDPRRTPRAKPFPTFDNLILGASDEIRFHISSPQSGSLYVINEGPRQNDGLPNFNFLFPDADIRGGSPEIRAGQVARIPLPGPNQRENWFVLDHEEGAENIWLIWSERAVPELEAVKGWANPKDHGAIRDLTQRASVLHYLASFSAIKPEVERDEVNKQTRLKVKGETLVWMMKLEHH